MMIVTGAGGMLGTAIVGELTRAGVDFRAYKRAELNIGTEDVRLIPEGSVVINCAGILKGTTATLPDIVRANIYGPIQLSFRAQKLFQISTDCVFNGANGPYDETATPDATDVYGISKSAGELIGKKHTTIRTSFVGLRHGLLSWVLLHRKGETIQGYAHWRWNGLYVATAAQAVVELVLSGRDGPSVVHLHGPDITKYAFIQMVNEAYGLGLNVEGVGFDDSGKVARDMRLRSNYPELQPQNARWDRMLDALDHDSNELALRRR